MKNLVFTLLVVPFLFLSCSKTLDEISSIGTFKSTITGDVDKQFDGKAAFVHIIVKSTTPQSSSLAVALTNISNKNEIVTLGVSNLTANGITEGTYTFSQDTTSVTLFLPSYITEQGTYNLPNLKLTNKIVINSIKDSRVKGDFEINLIDVVTKKAVKIVGTFDAIGTTQTK